MKKLILIISLGFILIASTVYVILDTFVLERHYANLADEQTTTIISTDNENINEISEESYFTLTTYREYNTDIYVVDIILGNNQTIQSALADNIYGKNVTDTTSNIAESVDATLAINGDFYGARSSGYVIRNGILLRESLQSEYQEDLVIWDDGSMSIITEGEISAQELVDQGALQVLSFGPGLIIDNEITVNEDSKVSKENESNPRSAIGYISENHYIFLVADGRLDESEGLSLWELANFMNELGCTQAYNLDGGGSSTLILNDEVINNPTTNGKTIIERKVSDILYVK